MADDMRDDMLRVGVITSAHGIKGEVKVFPTTDDPGRFNKLKEVWLDDGKSLVKHGVKGARFSKNLVILSLEDITDRDMAERLRKQELLIERKDAVKLAKDEYFITDLIGLKVIDDATNELIGRLKDVITTGANDVYEIEFDKDYRYEGEKPKNELLYAPAIKECVRSVDISRGEVRLSLMKGLVEV